VTALKTNPVRENLQAGGTSLGCFLGLESSSVAEMLGHAGFEWLMIEAEHNALDMAQVQDMIRAVNTTPAVPLVRIPSADRVFIQRVLDVGAMGIMVPMIRSLEEVRQVVQATRYPPEGRRAFGGLRASKYTFDNEGYFRRANQNILVIIIIETSEAVDQIDAIASEPGVDALMIGPFDLYLSYGLDPFKQPSPEAEAIMERVLAAGRKHNTPVGLVYGSPEQVKQRRDEGFQLLALTDYLMLANRARECLQIVSGELE